MNKKGSLTCVGTGITLGAHLTPNARNHITQADIVFSAMNSSFGRLWLTEMNSNVHDLQQYYQKGKPRSETYQKMVAVMLDAVRDGNKVVGAFYGHPGIFATPPHTAIAIAKQEGYLAQMLPGISADDCLLADCGIDPGKNGCASFEANQFIRYHRPIDNSAYLILWQVGILGDSGHQFSTSEPYKQLLVEVLHQNYPLHHEIILYEAPTLAIESPRITPITLAEFAQTPTSQITTMLIPPCTQMQKNAGIQAKLAQLDRIYRHK
ncbi:hypothetical protein FE810_04720 [Thalassotalea litorea]|uniref:Tetrapyrrole methylase domain-containing protein n=1 Tax=Thalassotalea litorea TaxID=2020715 RepID=A0A5R9IMN1_9GAMM|nr:SAM-dependent methyltransferase [Thalassotalea litorea]TLU66814.1 hypothetical protein FE810_04720 [Thalassotalea litorea]